MQVNEKLGWTGRIRVISRYLDGTEVIEEFDNLITDAGRNLLRNALQGLGDAKIKYVAWGNSATAPAVSNASMGNEVGRKVVTKQTAGAAGVGVTTVYLAPFDANGQIQELGWFAGSAATAAAGSGVLVARVLWSKLKTNLESVEIQRTDSIT